jgi:hypothetical protein
MINRLLDKFINNEMERHGFVLTDENGYGAYYERRDKRGFDHVICVLHKAKGKPLVQSYDKKTHITKDNYFINSVCGFEVSLLPLLWLKAKVLAHKYGWENWNWVGPSDKTKKELKRIRRERKHNR